MKKRIAGHILSIVFVTIVLSFCITLFSYYSDYRHNENKKNISNFIGHDFVNFNDPFERSLLSDLFAIYYPGQSNENHILIAEIISNYEDVLIDKLQRSHEKETLTISKITTLSIMYLKFICIYFVVLLLTYYGVQTIGVLMFVKRKQHSVIYAIGKKNNWLIRAIKKCFLGMVKIFAYSILFSPAYVIAYSVRTEFNTDSFVFMIILALISNGLLITYAHKFYTFLCVESRKGYVQTAIVKNLYNSYLFNVKDGISFSAIFSIRKQFKNHVFGHIFINAHTQYLGTIKEQASFLITGLIIIEMALNIHGYLNYEMLRQILYKNYSIVLVIVLGIFYAVKITEIITDILIEKDRKKYAN